MMGKSTEPFLAVERLRRDFVVGGERVAALADASLTMAEHGIATIVGPSGSGKSTLLNVVGCLDQVESGTVRLNGELCSNLKEREAARFRAERLGFIFQHFNLAPVLSALENVELALFRRPAQRRLQAEEALEAVGMAHRLHHRPSQLSGGEQQRVAIARALVRRPALVIADEPTANLDSRTAEAVFDLLIKLNKEWKVGFLIATHDQRLTDRMGSTFQMSDGRITQI